MHTHPRTAVAFILVAAVLVLGACAGEGELIEGADYPHALKQARTLDIQVTRDETTISLTNTTAAPIPAGKLWINTWYVRDFPGLAVGESITLDLHEFKDRYDDQFRAGGFWASDPPDRLSLAQIETGGELLGLIVVTQGGL